MATLNNLKLRAANAALKRLSSGMIVGLGSGSTAEMAIELLAKAIETHSLTDVKGIPSSNRTEKLARDLGIPLTDFDTDPIIDITIDGADEVDPDLNLIKGGGGALLREKIVAQASRHTVIIVDESKLSPRLGTQWPLPVEVLPFALGAVKLFLEDLGATVTLREGLNQKPHCTDQGNRILDAAFGPLDDPYRIGRQLDGYAGIMAHGLFLNLANEVIVADSENVQCLTRSTLC
jgi:ribose 5-phosphate isomerase A